MLMQYTIYARIHLTIAPQIFGNVCWMLSLLTGRIWENNAEIHIFCYYSSFTQNMFSTFNAIEEDRNLNSITIILVSPDPVFQLAFLRAVESHLAVFATRTINYDGLTSKY